MMYVFDASNKVANWMAAKLQTEFNPPYQAFGVVDARGEIIGGVLLNEHCGTDIECTMAGKVFFKGFLRFLYHYIFATNRCTRVSFTVHSSNQETIELLAKFGCTIEGMKRKYYGQYDAVLYGILKEEMPDWIKTRAKTEEESNEISKAA